MFDMMSNLLCLVTVTISFLYGTRVCWGCGHDCSFAIDPADKKQIIKSQLPAGFALYLFGFFVLFSNLFDGAVTVSVLSFTTALVVAHFVVSMSMPALKRNPNQK